MVAFAQGVINLMIGSKAKDGMRCTGVLQTSKARQQAT
jgi:hypothetical protein